MIGRGMRKRYDGLDWSEIMETVDHARALGLLREARLVPADGTDTAPDFDLEIAFDGFDGFDRTPGIEDLVSYVATRYREGGLTESLTAPETRPEAPAKPELGGAGHDLVVFDDADGSDTEGGVVEGEEQPEPVEPATTKPGPPADPPTEPAAEEGTRLCTKCRPTEGPKPISEFRPNANAKDGLSKVCKPCQSAMRRAANETKRAKQAREERRKEDQGRVGVATEDGVAPETRERFERAGRESHAPPETGEPAAEGAAEDPKAEAGDDAGDDGADPWKQVDFTRRRKPEERRPGPASLEGGGRKPSPVQRREAERIDRGIAELVQEELEKPRASGVVEVRRPAAGSKPAVYCANGADCAAPGIEGPVKLRGRKKKGDVCDACEERATGRFGKGA